MFVRISRKKLDTLIAQMGELVEMKIRMSDVVRRIREVERDLHGLERAEPSAARAAGDAPALDLHRQPLRQLVRGMEQDIPLMGRSN